MRVGFIGLGAMGLPMARRVVEGGHRLFTIVHRRREPAEELAALGARILATPAEVARHSEMIVTILPADAELKETVFGDDGLLKGFAPGKVLIEMATATPSAVLEVARAVGGAGGRLLDAPVSGGTLGAANGTLTIMAGGDADLLEQCRPLLETMGKNIFHVGAVGQGKVVKIVNQVMAAANLLAMGEAFALGVRCGADVKVLYDVIKASSGYSTMMDAKLPGSLFEGNFSPTFRLDLMKKDLNLALDCAQALGVPLVFGSLAAQVFAAASTAGRGDEDLSAAADFLAGLSGATLKRSPDRAA